MSEKHLSSLLDHPRSVIVLAVNQVEAHPCLPQHRLLELCWNKGILLVAYSPVGKQEFVNDQDIQAISRRLNVTSAQVILSWAVQRGTAVVPKYEYEARLVENISVSWIYYLTKFFSSVEGSGISLNCRMLICWHWIELTWNPRCIVRSVDSTLLNQEARALVGHMSNLAGSSNRVVSCANEWVVFSHDRPPELLFERQDTGFYHFDPKSATRLDTRYYLHIAHIG